MGDTIFHWEPDYNEISIGVLHRTLVTSVGNSGVEQRRSKWTNPKYQATLKFQKYLNYRGKINEIWEFFKARKGSFDSFWLPSFMHDTFLTADYISGTKIYVDKNNRFSAVSGEHGNYIYIYNGINYETEQVSSLGSDGGGDFIILIGNFNNQYIVNNAISKKVWIQTAYKVKFIGDSYEEDNIGEFVTQSGIRFVEVF